MDDFTRCTSRYFENCHLLAPEECLRSHITTLMQKGQSALYSIMQMPLV